MREGMKEIKVREKSLTKLKIKRVTHVEPTTNLTMHLMNGLHLINELTKRCLWPKRIPLSKVTLGLL